MTISGIRSGIHFFYGAPTNTYCYLPCLLLVTLSQYVAQCQEKKSIYGIYIEISSVSVFFLIWKVDLHFFQL